MRGRTAQRLAVLAAVAALAACSTTRPAVTTEHDPWEPTNRITFRFNDILDETFFEPIAVGWDSLTWEYLRLSIDKAMLNLRFPVRLVGNLTQGELRATGTETSRFVINSTVGVLGFFDPAGHWGIEPRDADFGQSLGIWGIPAGPYLVLPVFGPSNPRDAFGFAVDTVLSAGPSLVSPVAGLVITGVNFVNTRALLLAAVRDAKHISLDYYVFMRNAFVQRRNRQIIGEIPEEEIDDDFYDIEDDE